MFNYDWNLYEAVSRGGIVKWYFIPIIFHLWEALSASTGGFFENPFKMKHELYWLAVYFDLNQQI